MGTISIDPFAEFSREQLIQVIKKLEMQLAGMSERVKGLEAQNRGMTKGWEAFLRTLQLPHYTAQDADKMFQLLMDLESAIRPILGVENVRYGVQDYIYKKDTDPKLKAIAMILRDYLNYFGLDDK